MLTKRQMTAAAAVLGAVAVLGACGSTSGGGGGAKKLDPAGLVRITARAHTDRTTTCPLPYDMAKAAGKAGISGGGKAMTGTDAVTADSMKDAEPDSLSAKDKGAYLDCGYTVGSEDTRVITVGSQSTQLQGSAAAAVFPLAARDARMTTAQLSAYGKKVLAAAPNTATLTPSGNVAIVNLPATKGSVVVMVSVGDSGHTMLSAAQMTKLAGALAGQADW